MAIDWQSFYDSWEGRMNRFDCWPLCKGEYRCCRDNQSLILAPGEGDFLRSKGLLAEGDILLCRGKEHCYGNLRPLCCRTFPFHPDVNGMIYANTDCSQYKWASWKFIAEISNIWGQLLQSPEMRQWVADMWQQSYGKMPKIQANDIVREFDEDYARTFGALRSVFPIRNLLNLGFIKRREKCLVCGSGNGDEVRWLRYYGVDAYGIDINKSLVGDYQYCTVGDCRSIFYDDSTFDIVLTIDMLEHIPDYDRVLTEMRRVSRNLVYVQVTTCDNPTDMLEDPTHVVMLTEAEWSAELRRYFHVISHPFRSGWLLSKMNHE